MRSQWMQVGGGGSEETQKKPQEAKELSRLGKAELGPRRADSGERNHQGDENIAF